MKKLLGALVALAIVLAGGYAVTQSSPVPFNIVTNGGYVATDAGFIGNLTVLGTASFASFAQTIASADAGFFGALTVLGSTSLQAVTATTISANLMTSYSLAADAGTFAGITVSGMTFANGQLIVDGGITAGGSGHAAWCLGQSSLSNTWSALSTSVCNAAGAALPASEILKNDGTNNYIEWPSGAFLYVNQNPSSPTTYAEYGNVGGSSAEGVIALNIGNPLGSGSTVTNVGVGHCLLSAGVCNAVTPGTTGLSLCFCDFQGGNWAVDSGAFTCHVTADAGASTAYVFAGAVPIPSNPNVGIHCFN